MKLDDNIRFLKGVGEKRAELFEQLGVRDVGTLLSLYPRSYRDRSHPVKFSEASYDAPCCIKATVCSAVKAVFTHHNIVRYVFKVTDGESHAEITLFNRKYLAESIRIGYKYLFYGNVEQNLLGFTMSSPEIYDASETTIMPIYPQAAGLTSKKISNLIRTVLDSFTPDDPLSESIRSEFGLCGYKEALKAIHFPENRTQLEAAKTRLSFDELFFLQLGILLQKSSREKHTDIVISGKHLEEFCSLLPFSLTPAQLNAINEALVDMSSGKPMSRLLQGDVGSGKTMVAAAIAYCTAKSGMQTVIMAPTEVLAAQHYKTFQSIFSSVGINISLLTGSLTKVKKQDIKTLTESGETDILIGTHAVIEDDVRFKSLGLVITDEQHRFGVEQRTKLSAKGNRPHILVMSATPIPRTMSLIFYGDLDISVIDSLPKGRQPIETYLIDSKKRSRAFNYIKKHLDEGRQGYIICPMVEENEAVDLASAVQYYEKLQAEDFKDYSVGLLHGKMKPKEKDSVMMDFADGKIQLLVSTTVVEVGVDVPNSVIMLIENAERFGLSQLHQLRGRIGRGRYKSTCILISDTSSGDTAKRLKFICTTLDGFKIADEDLRLRGPGDFLGKRQHGLPELKIADLTEDMELFRMAGAAAKKLIADDPNLSRPENACLRSIIERLFETVKRFGYN